MFYKHKNEAYNLLANTSTEGSEGDRVRRVSTVPSDRLESIPSLSPTEKNTYVLLKNTQQFL